MTQGIQRIRQRVQNYLSPSRFQSRDPGDLIGDSALESDKLRVQHPTAHQQRCGARQLQSQHKKHINYCHFLTLIAHSSMKYPRRPATA
ncbi:hypothetical protein HX862_32905 [Pseudomonas sp. D5002]|nr:hypothetical protein [Pseudomonas sp. D5002]